MRPDRETLSRLYADERKTTRQIAAIYSVDKISVCRWLKRAGIERRAANRGLLNRGAPEPTAEELRRLVHDEHRSYREIGAMFGVDPSAIQHWLMRHDIRKPTVWETRYGSNPPVWPADPDLICRYSDGERVEDIADEIGVSQPVVIARLRALGVEIRRNGWDGGKRFDGADGHRVRSTYEQRVCNWLTERGIAHAYEPRLPWDLRSRADFLVNGWYVEVWGVTDSPTYATRRDRKIAGYQAQGANLVQIHHYDFSAQKRGRWQKRLAVISDQPVLL